MGDNWTVETAADAHCVARQLEMDDKMKLSTVLLSSAALLVAGAAYAADLPAKKAAPAAAPSGCAAFGAGYIAVPGGDSCLKISGYARAQEGYTSNVARPSTAPYSMAGSYGLQFDVKNQTEAGVVGSTIFIENNATTDANVSLGGFVAGKYDSPWDIGGGYVHTGDNMQDHSTGMKYSMPLGSTTITLDAVNAYNSNAVGVASRPDLRIMAETAMGAVKVNLGAASHEVAAATGTAQGSAFLGKVSFDAGVASFMGYAAYSNGANAYVDYGSGRATSMRDSYADSSSLATGSFVAGEVDVPLGKNDSFGLYAENLKITQDVNSYSLTQYSVSMKHTFGKGMWVRPEIWTDNENGTTTNGAVVRIERDF